MVIMEEGARGSKAQVWFVESTVILLCNLGIK